VAAIAVGLVAVGVLAGLTLHRGQPPAVRAAAMRAGHGERVGWAYARAGTPGRILVAIHGLDGDQGDYAIEIVIGQGRTAHAGNVEVRAGDGVAELTSPAPIEQLAAIRIVSAAGDYECGGTFSDRNAS
jgi:hypothetical protein